MQDADDSDAAPRDMFLNKMKQNKGIAAPLCTRAAALPFFTSDGMAGRPAATAAGPGASGRRRKPL